MSAFSPDGTSTAYRANHAADNASDGPRGSISVTGAFPRAANDALRESCGGEGDDGNGEGRPNFGTHFRLQVCVASGSIHYRLNAA